MNDNDIIAIYNAIRQDLSHASDSKCQPCFSSEQASAIAHAIIKASVAYDKKLR